MSTKTDIFIKTVGAIARNEYLSRKKWILPSICIAQAALESGWNLQARTLFGIKGSGFSATTTEYYNGHKVQIQDSFRSYPNVASAIVGYYDFLSNTPRYARALNNSDYKSAVNSLIHTLDGNPYATDPNYVSKICKIIEDFSLTVWDNRETSETVTAPVKADSDSQTYIIKSGDCLSVIAEKYGIDMNTLARVNNIKDVNKIYPGQVLKLSESGSSKTYTVKTGDCLSVIANKLGVNMNTLARVNNIKDVNKIYPGQILKY